METNVREHYDAQLAQASAQELQKKILVAFDVALDALHTIAMQDVDPSWQEAMGALRKMNGIVCGDESRMYRTPSVRHLDDDIAAEQAHDAELRR